MRLYIITNHHYREQTILWIRRSTEFEELNSIIAEFGAFNLGVRFHDARQLFVHGIGSSAQVLIADEKLSSFYSKSTVNKH